MTASPFTLSDLALSLLRVPLNIEFIHPIRHEKNLKEQLSQVTRSNKWLLSNKPIISDSNSVLTQPPLLTSADSALQQLLGLDPYLTRSRKANPIPILAISNFHAQLYGLRLVAGSSLI